MEPRRLETRCCVAGGGPAGIMLGFLLARQGIDVVVLEKWPDFFRDFRGDTIHPSTMQVLKELGLLEQFLALPHNETKQIAASVNGERIIIADFSKLKTACPFLGFIPQWDFLNFLSQEAQRLSPFRLLMQTEATDIIEENGAVVGVKAKDGEGELEIRATLVVGADGRHSTVREKAGLSLVDMGAPIDVLWFRLSQHGDVSQSLGYIGQGGMLVAIDRDSYWQCALIIHKSGFDRVKQEGIEAFRRRIAAIAPPFKDVVHEIASFDDVKLLSVTLDHLKTWHKPGLLCIGDAAHAMSPVGGVGINLAIQDAVAAARMLGPALLKGAVSAAQLKAVQARRERPALLIQRMQAFLHSHLLKPALEHGKDIRIPFLLRLVEGFPYLRRVPAYLVGIGISPEKVAE